MKVEIDLQEIERGNGGLFHGSFAGEKPVTDKTRKKYQDEAIEYTACEKGLESNDLRVYVDLARLNDALADPDAPELASAVESGYLRLTVPLLAKLLRLNFDDLSGRVRELLVEQI